MVLPGSPTRLEMQWAEAQGSACGTLAAR